MRALRVLLFSASDIFGLTKDLFEKIFLFCSSITSDSSILEILHFLSAQACFLIEKSTVGRQYDCNVNLAGDVREIEREKARDQRS